MSGFVLSARVLSINEHCILGNHTPVRLFMHYIKVELKTLINVK